MRCGPVPSVLALARQQELAPEWAGGRRVSARKGQGSEQKQRGRHLTALLKNGPGFEIARELVQNRENIQYDK